MFFNKLIYKQIFVFIAALAVVFLSVLWIEFRVFKSTGGTFMYPLDDTFIHMALAKNLALYGNWGITKYEFASASSSILYTLLLAASFKLFSIHIWFPFLINIIAAFFLLFVIFRWLQKQNVSPVFQMIILIAAIFFTPVPILIVSGMEHTLQCLFCFLFIFYFSQWLGVAIGTNAKEKIPLSVYVTGALVTAIRYEGMFVIVAACILLLFYKRFFQSISLGVICFLPIIIFGLYSISKGSYFFPNSVLLKSKPIAFSIHGLISYAGDLLVQKLTVPAIGITSLATQRLLIILPLTYLVFIKQLKKNLSYNFILLILIITAFMHLSFASTGWFYRYEAYLILCSCVIISVLIYKFGKEVFAERKVHIKLVAVVLLFALFFPLVLRSTAAFSKASIACHNIYEQQFQMARFVSKYYKNDVIAANDIGAVCFYTQGKNLDLWGLGNFDVAKSKKEGYWTPDFLDSISRQKHVKVAVVYDSWFSDSLLHRWNKVANWKITDNVICGDDNVTFYALSEDEGKDLRKNLEAFQALLPSSVLVKYY